MNKKNKLLKLIPEFKRTVSFIDDNKQLAKIDIEITHINGYPEFSISGDYANGFGQCDGHIKPKNETQSKLLSMWHEHHLNGMTAGTPEQEQLILKGLETKELKTSSYDDVVSFLKKHKKYSVFYKKKKYQYGTGWIRHDLPLDIIAQINNVCDEIEKINQKEKELIISKKWDIIEDNKIIALSKFLGIEPQEAQEYITTDDEETYIYAGVSYYVLTDDEADRKAKDYLTDDTYLWQESVKAGNTTDGLDDWAKYVLDCDGRGSVLNSYDGSEESEQVNEEWFYIYRN